MSIYTQYQPEEGSGIFLKLKDGDKVKMRIASECVVSLFKPTDKVRYNWVVFNRDENKAQIYSAGISVYKQIAALVEDWGDPDSFDIRISRSGSGMNDTEYIVTPVKESKNLTSEEDNKVAEIDLLERVKGSVTLEDFFNKVKFPTPMMQEPINATTFSDGLPLPTDEEIISLEDM